MNSVRRLALLAAAIALSLPVLAPAQQRAAPPLPERLRGLDESLRQEHEDLVKQVAALGGDQGRMAAALKAQLGAWLQYRDATCALAGLSGAAAQERTLQCKADWAEAQRLRLWPALDCVGQVTQVAPAERGAELERCLQAFVSTLRP